MQKYIYLIIMSFMLNQVLYADTFKLPQGPNSIVGTVYEVVVAKRIYPYELSRHHEITTDSLIAANPDLKHGRRIASGTKVIIPRQYILPEKKFREGIVINVPEKRLYYFTQDGKYVITYPVALGKLGWRTPVMQATVKKKAFGPVWYVPKSIHNYYYKKYGKKLPHQMAPFYKDIRNPLGSHALYLTYPGILIHGTSKASSVGLYTSSGCIRMYNSAISLLYDMVPLGAPVTIMHHPTKYGWLNGQYYFVNYPELSAYIKPENMKNDTHQQLIKSSIGTRIISVPTPIKYPKILCQGSCLDMYGH